MTQTTTAQYPAVLTFELADRIDWERATLAAAAELRLAVVREGPSLHITVPNPWAARQLGKLTVQIMNEQRG